MSENETPKPETPPEESSQDFEVVLAEMRSEMTALLETSQGQVTSLAEEHRPLAEQVGRLEEINNLLRLSEKVADFMQLEEHPGKQVAPAFADQIVQILLAAPEVEDDILTLLSAVASGEAVVEFGERGTGDLPKPLTNDAMDSRMRLHEKAMKLASESEIPYREALIKLGKEA